jgi:plasmid replication initiation protein
METTEIVYNENALVVQANEIIRSRQDNFSLLEAKLIRLAISQVAMEETDFRTYTCKVSDLAAFLDIPPENIYREVETLTTSLMQKIIKIVDKDKKPKRNGEYNYKKFHWVSYCRYDNGTITIRLSEEIKPYVLGLDKLFTLYGLDSILSLPTSNAIRLFELLSSYESMVNTYAPNFTPSNPYPQIQKQDNELIFTIDYLRRYFNCGDKYPLTADFIKRIIEPSVKAINKSSPMRTSYRLAKEGRKVSYILFKINAWNDADFMEFITACN